jgi:hypothetical protein
MVRSMKVETPIESGAALRALLAEVFGADDVVLPAHIDALLRLYAPLPDQRPATCGAYALTYLLPARGFAELDGASVIDEDFMAHLAADTIEAGEVAASAAIQARVDRGELTEAEAMAAHRRDWYRYPIDSSAEPSEVGTSPQGVARAIALASGGRLATAPIAGRDASGRVQLDSHRWDRCSTWSPPTSPGARRTSSSTTNPTSSSAPATPPITRRTSAGPTPRP